MNTDKLLEDHKIECQDYVRKFRKDKNTQRDQFKNILPQKYHGYVKRANIKGLEFEMTLNLFNKIISMPCSYCGVIISNGVDRINSKAGYTDNNIQPCCGVCNLLKNTKSHEIFIEHIEKIYNNQSKKSL